MIDRVCWAPSRLNSWNYRLAPAPLPDQATNSATTGLHSGETSREDVGDDSASDIGKAFVTAVVEDGQLLMVKTE